jgi:hypothetical protein
MPFRLLAFYLRIEDCKFARYKSSMARDSMQAMPMSSPRQEFGSAAVQWACTRRGRMMGLMVVLVLVFVGLMELDNHQVRICQRSVKVLQT